MTRVLGSPAEAFCLGVACTADSPWDDKHKAEIGAGGVLGRWQGLGDISSSGKLPVYTASRPADQVWSPARSRWWWSTHTHTHRHTDTHSETHTLTCTQTHIQRHTLSHTHRHTDTHRHTHRHTHSRTAKWIHTHRDRHTHSCTHRLTHTLT